jgi:hypothetical protein
MTTVIDLPPREARRARVTVTCDRCGRHVAGVGNDYGTSGFYSVGCGYWSLYARPHEVNVCDACMWADAGFRHDYLISPFGSQEARDRRLEIDREHLVRGSRYRC